MGRFVSRDDFYVINKNNKVYGQKASIIICDEYEQISDEIFETIRRINLTNDAFISIGTAVQNINKAVLEFGNAWNKLNLSEKDLEELDG